MLLHRILKVVGGLVLVAAGIAMLVLPGPGTVVLAIGLALVLSQFAFGRRIIARIRVRLRDRFGSPRVRRVEEHIPEELAPRMETTELRIEAQRRRKDRARERS